MNRYIADLHFSHNNVIKFDNRPFATVEEMNQTLVDNWNSVVKNEDTTYILGDFCWLKEAEWIKILDKLKGNKVLIEGNHDLKKMSKTLKDKFTYIKEKDEISDCGKKVIMSHYPEMAYKSSYNKKVFMLYGHVHNHTKEAEFIKKWTQELRDNCISDYDNKGQIINVGCMMSYMDYTPRTLKEILHSNGFCLDEI